ncbi:MAG: mannose-1-phosphate guanylyltransferase [Flavobacteriaceae bacterium]
MKETKDYFALIMAGGVGSRFWPTSRSAFPKQFQDLTGSGKTLLQQTYDRLEGVVSPEQIYVLTNANYIALVNDQLPQLGLHQIICEPVMRNTAPCLLYAALKIHHRNPQAKMIVLPSDHFIANTSIFRKNALDAFKRATVKNELLTFGIPPQSAHTGYGYLRVEEKDSSFSPIVKFTEKPSEQNARSFLASGNYFWNSGIFVWSSQSILAAFELFQPEMLALFEEAIPFFGTQEEKTFLSEQYALAENISIDYAILEKAKNITMIKAGFFWNDLGTWSALHEQLAENSTDNVMVNAKVISEASKGNMIYTANEKIVVTQGLDNFVIVDEGDVLLIYPKGKDQSVKALRKKTTDEFGDSLA